MRAIILAAGNSSRLLNKFENIPKGLLDINGKSIIQRQIILFREKKIDDIIIVTGPNSDEFDFKDVTYVKDQNYTEHEVLGSLMEAKDLMNTEMIMTYSDILFDKTILEHILNFQDDIGIATETNWLPAYKNRSQHTISQADNVLIKNGKIIEIRKNMMKYLKNEKLGEFFGIMHLSSTGAKNFVKVYDKLIKTHTGQFHNAPSLKKAYLTDMLQELIDLNFNVKPILCKGMWCEVDTPEDLEIACKKFRS
jgi:phosphoenolpyruvate phosphomutase